MGERSARFVRHPLSHSDSETARGGGTLPGHNVVIWPPREIQYCILNKVVRP